MQLSIRNLSSQAVAVEIYAIDPASSSPTAVCPTYSVTITPPDTSATVAPWTRSGGDSDVVAFFAATNDGTGPQNVTKHVPTGTSNVGVRLMDDGNGGLTFTFTG